MTAALIIAAGSTPRKQGFAPMQQVGSIGVAQRIIKVLQRAQIERIVLILGADSKRLERQVSRMQVVCLHAPADAQMLDSVKTGLSYLQDKCDAALVTPSDIPLFTVETVHALLQATGPVRVPVHAGRRGHPLLLEAAQFGPVLSYMGPGGLAGAIRALNLPRTDVPVEDMGVLHHIQHEPHASTQPQADNLRVLYPELQLWLSREQPFFGPEARQLLLLTEEAQSLREACARMGISYSKGWNMIALIEGQLGRPVIARQQGGSAGGHSRLTGEGLLLLARYNAFATDAQAAIRPLFEKHFGDYEYNK